MDKNAVIATNLGQLAARVLKSTAAKAPSAAMGAAKAVGNKAVDTAKTVGSAAAATARDLGRGTVDIAKDVGSSAAKGVAGAAKSVGTKAKDLATHPKWSELAHGKPTSSRTKAIAALGTGGAAGAGLAGVYNANNDNGLEAKVKGMEHDRFIKNQWKKAISGSELGPDGKQLLRSMGLLPPGPPQRVYPSTPVGEGPTPYRTLPDFVHDPFRFTGYHMGKNPAVGAAVNAAISPAQYFSGDTPAPAPKPAAAAKPGWSNGQIAAGVGAGLLGAGGLYAAVQALRNRKKKKPVQVD